MGVAGLCGQETCQTPVETASSRRLIRFGHPTLHGERHLSGATTNWGTITSRVSQAGRSMLWLAGTPARLVRWRSSAPERLLIAPQDIRTSDPTIAADINAGYFAFGGKIVHASGRSPFDIEPGSEIWTRHLTGFGWLRHLRAADTPAGRRRGRTLVASFLDAHPRPGPGPQWEPAVVARRLISWLSQSPVILDGADRDFYTRFLLALETQRAVLARHIAAGPRGPDRLIAAIALAEFGLCVDGVATLQKRGSGALATEVEGQILPDGGHVSRNPQTLIDLLLDLLPLRQAYAARGIQCPQPVLNAIDRMMPMLRLFRHGDGALALFNGMGVTAPELVATILAYDDVRGRPIVNARASGYQRLEGGQTIAVVDAGGPPPRAFSSAAHAGCLSFELSSGAHRLVINCGAPDGARPGPREAARSTAAHSTLTLDDTSSCRFAPPGSRGEGGLLISGPREVEAEREEGPRGTVLRLSHDGYAAEFGLIHQRLLSLSAAGDLFEGHDRLIGADGELGRVMPFALRFHLHPSVKAKPQSAHTVRLDAPDGDTWLFEASAPAATEPTILFAAVGGPRQTTQIRLNGLSGTGESLNWRFRRLS